MQAIFEQAEALRKQGKVAEAIQQYEKAVELASRAHGPNDLFTATLLHNLGALYQTAQDYDKAEDQILRGLKIREAGLPADHPNLALSVSRLAEVYRLTGQYARAEPLYQRTLDITKARHGPDHVKVAQALNNLALLHEATGRYDRAEPLYRSSLQILKAKLPADDLVLAASQANLGRLYQSLGQFDKARPLLQRSLDIREAKLGAKHALVAQSLNHLADVYRAVGEGARAEQLYRRSLQIAQTAQGQEQLEAARSLNNLALLYEAREEFDRMEPLLKRSLEIKEARLGKDHPDAALSLQNLCGLYQALGRYDEARQVYARSLRVFEGRLGPNHPRLAQNLYSLMLLHAAEERWGEAAAIGDQVCRIVRRHTSRVLPALSEAEQLRFLHVQHDAALHAALSMALARRRDAGLAERSAGWVLNGKAVAQQALAERTLLARDGGDAVLGQVVEQLVGVRTKLASLSLQGPAAGQEAVHRRQLERLAEQEQTLSKRLGQAGGRRDRAEPWVELAEVRKALPANTVLIEIACFRGRDFRARGTKGAWQAPHYAAWVIPARGRGEVCVVDLGPAEPIEEATEAMRQALREAPYLIPERGEEKAERELRRPLTELARLVLHPLAEYLGKAERLVISPDASLWLVPWAALPLPDGRLAIEQYRISHVVSGRDLVNPPAKGQPGPALVLANPDYNLKPAPATKEARRPAAPAALRLPPVKPLPGTAAEARAIAPKLRAYTGAEPRVFLDKKAQEEVFKAARGPRVVVLSTHGYFLEVPELEAGARAAGPGLPLENPLLRCGLLLAGANERDQARNAGAEDGVLTGLEIVGSDLRGTELVVLSACDSATGRVQNGEGVAGLRQAFQLAGARSVVATLWPIPDQETVPLMSSFFGSLAGGRDKADALREAQLALIKSLRARSGAAHPFFWAAFTLTGHWQ